MNLAIDTEELKLQSLINAMSYAPMENDAPCINVPEFNYTIIKEEMALDDKWIDDVHSDSIYEMIQLIDNNRAKLKIDSFNCIGFYWRNAPCIIIRIEKETHKEFSKMIRISIKTYEDQVEERLNDKKFQRGVVVGLGGLVLAGGLFGLFSMFRSKN